MANFSVGSASVNIVPDFTGAQASIDRWISTQKPLNVSVRPVIDSSAEAALRTRLAAIPDAVVKVKPELDGSSDALLRARLAALPNSHTVHTNVDTSGITAGVKQIVDSFIGFQAVTGMIDKVFGPASTLKVTAVGALVEVAAAASQAGGALALLPAGMLAAGASIATLKIGVSGLSDAFKALNGTNPAATAAALAKLAPAARDFVTQVHALAPAFTALKLDVQQKLFDDLGQQVNGMAKLYLPALHQGLGGIATGFNAVASNIMGVLSQKANVAAFGDSLKNVASATMNSSEGFGALTQTFLTLTSVGSSFLPQLANGFSSVAVDLQNFIQHIAQTGQLQVIIQNAIDVIKQLGSIVGNVGGVLVNVFKVAVGPGQIVLGVLGQITGALKTLTGSVTGQNALSTFFDGISSAVKALQPGINALLGVLVTSVLPAIGGIVKALAPVVNDLLVSFAGLLKTIAPLIYPALASALAAMASAIQPVISALTPIMTTLLPIITKLMNDLAPIVGNLTALLGNELAKIIQMLAPLLVKVGDAFIQILNAIMPLLPPIFDLINALLPPLIQIFEAVIPIVVQIVQALAPLIIQITNFLVPIVKVLGDVVAAVFKAIAAVITWALNTIVVPLLQMIVGSFTSMGNDFKGVYDNIIKPVFNAFSDLATWLFIHVMVPIFEGFQKEWSNLAAGFRAIYDNVIHPVWQAFVDAINWVEGAFRDGIVAITGIWLGIEKALRDPVQWVIDVVWNNGLRNLWNTINNIWGGNDLAPFTFANGGMIPQQFADGGMMPGYTPGRDVHRFYSPTAGFLELSGGEPVLRPEAGRVLGASWVDGVNSAARNGGENGVRRYLGGYADGGIIGLGARDLSAFEGNPVVQFFNTVFLPGGNMINQLTDYVSKEAALTKNGGGSPIFSMIGDMARDGANHLWTAVTDALTSWLSPSGAGGAQYITAQQVAAANLAASLSQSGALNSGIVAGLTSSHSANVIAVQNAAAAYGWSTGAEWNALIAVINRESGFNNVAQNPTSTAYGMFQFLNSTWAAYGPKTSDPNLQAKYGMEYIAQRYHDPLGALAHEQQYGWYDSGGWLPPGWSTVFNGTGRPEPVLTATEHDALLNFTKLVKNQNIAGGGLFRDVHIHADRDRASSIMDELLHRMKVASKGGVYSVATVSMAG